MQNITHGERFNKILIMEKGGQGANNPQPSLLQITDIKQIFYLHILCLRAMYLMIALLCTIFLSPSSR